MPGTCVWSSPENPGSANAGYANSRRQPLRLLLFSEQAHRQRRYPHRHANSDGDVLKTATRRLPRALDVLRPDAHTNQPCQHMLNSRYAEHAAFNCQGAFAGPGFCKYPLRSALWAKTCTACVTRVGNSRRCCTCASHHSVIRPSRSGSASRFAVATAS